MENQIQEEVERLREQCSNTRELYREVCALLFFRYGVTPTTNKLYQLVRKGSMSVPTEVLSTFWKELREKSKIKIEQPDLPEDLSNLTGELIAKIWDKAQLEANESLQTLREEVEVKVEQLQAERDRLANGRDELVSKLQNVEDMLAQRCDELTKVNHLFEESETQRISLEKQLHENTSQFERLQQTMENELSLAAQEISREQARADDLEKKLSAARTEYQTLQDNYQNESNSLKAQLADLRETVGKLYGKLEMTQANNEQLNAEIKEKDKKLKEALTEVSKVTPTKNWSDKIHQRRTKRLIVIKR